MAIVLVILVVHRVVRVIREVRRVRGAFLMALGIRTAAVVVVVAVVIDCISPPASVTTEAGETEQERQDASLPER